MTGTDELMAGNVLTDGDELLGEDDDLGATDDPGEERGGDGLTDAELLAAGEAAVRFPAAAGDSAPGQDALETGSREAGSPDTVEKRPGRSRRRDRAAVPV
jgi:hypothetical protein